MKEHRIYTDPRCAGIEFHNEGDARFRAIDRRSGRVLDSFAGFEVPKQPTVSEAFAAQRAKAYFDRMVLENRQMAAEMAQAVRDTEVAERTGRDFSDEQVISPDSLLDGWEQAQAMEDSPEKAARLKQLRAQAAQLETAAEEVVRSLLN